ncbi:MAG: hypothetical protein KDA93_17665 [Planctomycetaceae bacterium]|nr:hypothetical protein [Planctomycetaceae bacterium]
MGTTPDAAPRQHPRHRGQGITERRLDHHRRSAQAGPWDQVLFVDLGAESTESSAVSVLTAEREQHEIAVEIKTFGGTSMITELYLAVGQYIVYQLALSRLDQTRTLYLAVSDIALKELLSMPAGQFVVTELPLNLIFVDVESHEVTEWIARNSTRESLSNLQTSPYT